MLCSPVLVQCSTPVVLAGQSLATLRKLGWQLLRRKGTIERGLANCASSWQKRPVSSLPDLLAA